MKKTLSLILSVIILFSCTLIASASETTEYTAKKFPGQFYLIYDSSVANFSLYDIPGMMAFSDCGKNPRHKKYIGSNECLYIRVDEEKTESAIEYLNSLPGVVSVIKKEYILTYEDGIYSEMESESFGLKLTDTAVQESLLETLNNDERVTAVQYVEMTDSIVVYTAPPFSENFMSLMNDYCDLSGVTFVPYYYAISEGDAGACSDSPESVVYNRFGDFNMDGKVTVSDSRQCLRCAVNLDSATQDRIYLCDYAYDGKIDVSDARLVLRAAIGFAVNRPRNISSISLTSCSFNINGTDASYFAVLRCNQQSNQTVTICLQKYEKGQWVDDNFANKMQTGSSLTYSGHFTVSKGTSYRIVVLFTAGESSSIMFAYP